MPETAKPRSTTAIPADTVARAVGAVVSVLTPDLLHPRYRGFRSVGNPTAGHCAAACEAVYFLLGGPLAGLAAFYAREDDGTTHWWLETGDGTRVDPTADQYRSTGRVPPYERGRPGRGCGFMGQRSDPGSPYGFGMRPGLRAARILARVAAARGLQPGGVKDRRPGPCSGQSTLTTRIPESRVSGFHEMIEPASSPTGISDGHMPQA